MRRHHLFLSAVAASIFVTSCAPSQHSVVAESAERLSISGQLTMRERIALSPLAAAQVELIDASSPGTSVLGQQRIPFNGRQVPIAFNLVVDPSRMSPGGNFILRGAIEDGDSSMRWTVNAPVSPEPGATRLDLGTLVAARDDAAAEPPSVPPAPAGYRARGNEPGWALELGSSDLNFTWNTGQDRMTAPLPKAQKTSAGRRYRVRQDGKVLVVDIAGAACRDTMSGMTYPDIVTVTFDGKRLKGCGGEPASLLQGREWSVASIAGVAVVAGTRLTMAFGSDGNLSGTGGCNRFSAGYTLTGEGLSIGPGLRTQMGCEPPIMTQEDRFMALLDQVRSFEVPGSDRLALVTAAGEQIVARR